MSNLSLPELSSPALFTVNCGLTTVNSLSTLSLLFPLHTTIPPVSPLFPLDTKIEGGGGAKHFVTPAHFLKLFKSFQANSFLCRVFSFFRGAGGYVDD